MIGSTAGGGIYDPYLRQRVLQTVEATGANRHEIAARLHAGFKSGQLQKSTGIPSRDPRTFLELVAGFEPATC